MCGPAAIGLVLGAAGMVQSMSASAQSGAFQQGVADYNASNLERAAKASVLYGAGEASNAIGTGSRTIAKARAMAAASGVDVQSPGLLGVLETTRETAALDAETIKNNALREALGYKAQAGSYRLQGQVAGANASNQILSEFLSGAGGMYGQAHKLGLLDTKPEDYGPTIGSPGNYFSGMPTVGKGP